jgi:putative tryptophan/tyrosine transport system substrate-binding protein
MKRRNFIMLAGAAMSAWPLTAGAQQKLVPVIGFLGSSSLTTNTEQLAGIRQGLAETGFIEGQNLAIEYRWAEGVYDRLPPLAAEFVARNVDVIIAQAPPAARAAKAATSTIPVVFGVGTDPVAEGLVASLARPGGNLTGVTLLSADLMAKRLNLIAELAPGARRFAVLTNPNNPNPWIGAMQETARKKGVELQILTAATAVEIDAAFAAMTQMRAEALVLGDDTFFSLQYTQILALASHNRMPSIGFLRRFAETGGLISYGTSLKDAYRKIGLHAGQILKGAKPADLAVQQPTKFEMVLNMKTAKALGLTIPPLVLAQADEVIE